MARRDVNNRADRLALAQEALDKLMQGDEEAKAFTEAFLEAFGPDGMPEPGEFHPFLEAFVDGRLAKAKRGGGDA